MTQVNDTLCSVNLKKDPSDPQGWGPAPLCLLPVPRRVWLLRQKVLRTFPEQFLEGVGSKSHIAEGGGGESFQEAWREAGSTSSRAVGEPDRETSLRGFFFKMRKASPQRFIVKKLKQSKVKRTSEWTAIYSPPRFFIISLSTRHHPSNLIFLINFNVNHNHHVVVMLSHVCLCGPMDCSPPGSCPWDSPGRNTGVGCLSPLQGIFLTQGSNPGLLPLQAGA